MSEIKPGTTPNIPGPTGPDGSFSLEDLDRMLEVEDPGFKASLESIQTDRNNSDTSIESLDVEVDGATEDVTEKKGPGNRACVRRPCPHGGYDIRVPRDGGVGNLRPTQHLAYSTKRLSVARTPPPHSS